MIGANLNFCLGLQFSSFSHQILQREVLIHEKLMGKSLSNVKQNIHRKFLISGLDYELVKSFEIYNENSILIMRKESIPSIKYGSNIFANYNICFGAVDTNTKKKTTDAFNSFLDH